MNLARQSNRAEDSLSCWTDTQKLPLCVVLLGLWLVLFPLSSHAQTYTLESVNDSTSVIVLSTDSTTNRWTLHYPVYQFQVGDVDGNGTDECLVGVIKSTRYYKNVGRRLFVFKNVRGKIRPMWMGSKLGGILQDFKLVRDAEDNRAIVRSLETTTDGKYVVAEYGWYDFGFTFIRFLTGAVSEEEAMKIY